MKKVLNYRRTAVASFALSLMLVGCVTSKQSEVVVPVDGASHKSTSHSQYRNKRVAILPVRTEAALTTDSVNPLRGALNRKIDDEIRRRLNGAKITDVETTAERINQQNKFEMLDRLFATYNSTGILDKRIVGDFSRLFGSDYLVVSRLKVESMDVGFLTKGSAATLDVLLVDARTAKITWGGIGQYKKGGIFGKGGTPPEKTAEELVNLVFEKF